jgi:hypothetical protein
LAKAINNLTEADLTELIDAVNNAVDDVKLAIKEATLKQLRETI